jgi:hypothetical protein
MLAGCLCCGMCPSDQPSLYCFALPHTCIWIPPILQLVSDRLASHHVLLVVPSLPSLCDDDAGWVCWHVSLLTSLLCLLLPYPTHAPGSLLILQRVSDCQAARHGLLVVCPRCSNVCRWLAVYASMCTTDLPALFSLALPHACIWIPPISAGGE